MISWATACESVGYDPKQTCPHKDKTVYFAYKEGQVHKCVDKQSAQSISTLWERVTISNPAKQKWEETTRALAIAATGYWYTALRNEYHYLSDKVFGVCYDRAYEVQSKHGLNSVTEAMKNTVEFAELIVKASGGKL